MTDPNRRIDDRLPTEPLDWEDPEVKHARESTRLANAMAEAGAAFLAHMDTGGVIAQIPNTDQYVVAGTLAMIAKVLPADAPIPPLTAPAPLADDCSPEQYLRNVCADVLLALRNTNRESLAALLEGALTGLAAPAPQQSELSDYVLMPKRLTAENGAKGALSGEFKESVQVTCPVCDGSGDDPDFDGDPTEHGDACLECNGEGTVAQNVPVSWDTIKDIYKAAVDLLAKAAPAAPVQTAEQINKAYVSKLQAHALCLLDAATVYAFSYMQDEAEDDEDCVCGEEQHERAKAVFAAIKSLSKVLDAPSTGEASKGGAVE